MRIAVLALSALPLSGPVLAADPDPTAKGSFKSKTITMDVKSAVAFHGTSLLDKDRKDALIVAVSNSRMVAAALADYLDRKRAIEKRLKDDETGIVYFELMPDGKYRGLSYYFGSGNGCGYCGGGEVSSTVKLSNGKLSGSLKGTERDRPFDISLDVPVMIDDHGTALAADGGEPGKAYLAYHAALVKMDKAAVKAVLSDDLLEVYERSAKKANLDGYIAHLAEDHPVKSVRVMRGFTRPDKAVLAIEGESAAGKLVGEVLLVRQRGAWRVDDELTDLKIE